jgi:hypothetical protein
MHLAPARPGPARPGQWHSTMARYPPWARPSPPPSPHDPMSATGPGAATGFTSCPAPRPRGPVPPTTSPPLHIAGQGARRCHQSAPAGQKSASGARCCHRLRLGPVDVTAPAFACAAPIHRAAWQHLSRGCPLVSKTSSREEEKDREQNAHPSHPAPIAARTCTASLILSRSGPCLQHARRPTRRQHAALRMARRTRMRAECHPHRRGGADAGVVPRGHRALHALSTR